MKPYYTKSISSPLTFLNKGKIIEEHARRTGAIIYGSQALKKQIGMWGREPNDYDLIAKRPSQNARILAGTLNRLSHSHDYYTKPNVNEGVYSVKNVGLDNRRGTSDDIQIADVSRPKGSMKIVKIQGKRYVHWTETEANKKRTIRMKKYEHRHEKDREDVERIKLFREWTHGR